MRWESEAEEALSVHGFDVVVERAGIDDYQGWGVILASSKQEFAVLSWSYGSCSGCDSYEDLPHEQVVEELAELIEKFASEDEARASFNNRKGW